MADAAVIGTERAMRFRVASAPVSFGVDEVLADDAWMPGPEELLDWMASLDFVGTELGPPGYLGEGPVLRERLETRGLALVGAFLPQRFHDPAGADEDRAWLRRTVDAIVAGTPAGSRPFAVLCEGIAEPLRRAYAGRIAAHPEACLPAERWPALVDEVHRAAELCTLAGLEAVFHPHAGTFVETADEIARLAERLDPALVGLCLDTGHFRFGGADPAAAARDYRDLVRHVHVKDCRLGVIAAVDAAGGDLTDELKAGVFCPLGEGDVDVAEVLAALEETGYEGWLVVEQDQSLTAADTRETLVAGQRRNREFLRGLGV